MADTGTLSAGGASRASSAGPALEERWLASLVARPGGWLAAFLTLSALLIGGMLVWWAVFGFWHTLSDPSEPLGLSFDGRNHMTLAVLLAFVATATVWGRRGSQRDIRHLAETTGIPAAEVEAALDRSHRSSTLARTLSGVGALVVGCVIIPLSGGRSLSMTGWDMHHVWAVANNVGVFFLMFDSGWLTVRGWRTLRELTARHDSVDLLDRQELTSIGRIGLRSAVLWLGGGTIASTLTWGMQSAAPVFVILAVLLAFATLSLLLPAFMARDTLRDAKRAELERVREKIAAAREDVFSGAGERASQQAAVLQGLLAYEARIESVPEWPYDTSTLVRFGLLALVATGSWVGGALVERIVSAVLD